MDHVSASMIKRLTVGIEAPWQCTPAKRKGAHDRLSLGKSQLVFCGSQIGESPDTYR